MRQQYSNEAPDPGRMLFQPERLREQKEEAPACYTIGAPLYNTQARQWFFKRRRITSHMFGKDPKKIEKMMKKLNLNVRQVEAEEVIIMGKSRKIVIKNPEIMIANMVGREVYQITGDVEESVPASEE